MTKDCGDELRRIAIQLQKGGVLDIAEIVRSLRKIAKEIDNGSEA